MPRAVAGESQEDEQIVDYLTLPGVLVECDPSIKAILVKIDTEHHHDFIIQEIDDEHLLIKSDKHEALKQLLRDVCRHIILVCYILRLC